MPYGSGERVTYAKATPLEGFERDFKGLRVIIEMNGHLQSVRPAGLDPFDEWRVAHPLRPDLFMVSKADVPIRKVMSVGGMVSTFGVCTSSKNRVQLRLGTMLNWAGSRERAGRKIRSSEYTICW